MTRGSIARSRCPWLALAVIWTSGPGCGSPGGTTLDALGDEDVLEDQDTDPGPPPVAPSADDPAFTVSQLSDWLLVGDGLTPEDTVWRATVTAPASVSGVEAWIDGDGPHGASGGAGSFDVQLDVTGLAVGFYQVVLAEPGASTGFASRTFHRSNAIYAVMATDWDDADNADYYLNNMDVLRARHPELRYSHYFGPYSLTDPTVSDGRRAQLVEWLLARRDANGDEIGVHLHPYCTFVDTTDVTCRTEPSDVYAAGDPSGYTVIVSSYTVEEMTALLVATADLFEANGLGRPTSFRAGGWTADEGTLHAVQAAGYTVDVDAIVADRIEEWEGLGNGVFYEWLMEHWGDITITSQPYHPQLLDASLPGTGDDAFDILEIPANAVIVDYVTASEMLETFEANWPGHGPLSDPVIWHTGLHPPNFSPAYMNTLGEALTTVDLYLHSAGTGPVIYATATELDQVDWP